MYLARNNNKPLKPFKPNANGVKIYVDPAPAKKETNTKPNKILVKGKNVPKRKYVASKVESPHEYDTNVVKKFMDESGAPDPDYIPNSKISSKTLAPVKSSKINLPQTSTGISTKIQPRQINSVQPVKTTSSKPQNPAPVAPPSKEDTNTISIKKKKDAKLYKQLIETVEPDSSEDDLLKEALDGEFEEDDVSEEEEEDDELLSD